MSHQMDSKNGCHGIYFFRVFGRNLFNRMMNRFESRWFIAIIGEVYHLVWNETNHLFILVQQSKFHFITKKKQPKNNMILQDALSAVDAAKQFLK